MKALIDWQFVASRLGEPIDDAADRLRVEAFIDDASAQVRTLAGATWVDDEGELLGDDEIPPTVRAVVASAAMRAYLNPDALTSATFGGYAEARGAAVVGVYLTGDEKKAVLLAVGRNLLGSITVQRPEYVGGVGNVFAPVDGGGDPVPMIGPADIAPD